MTEITGLDHANARAFLAAAGVKLDDQGFDQSKADSLVDTLAIYGKAIAGVVRNQARNAAIEEAAKVAEGLRLLAQELADLPEPDPAWSRVADAGSDIADEIRALATPTPDQDERN